MAIPMNKYKTPTKYPIKPPTFSQSFVGLHSPAPADNSRRLPSPIGFASAAEFDAKSNDEVEEEEEEKTAESVAKSANKARPQRNARALLLLSSL